MTYKSAQIYTVSECVNIAVGLTDPNQRQIVNVAGTTKTLSLSDSGKAIVFSSSDPITVTIPDDSSYDFTIGYTFLLIQNGLGTVSVEPENVSTLNGTTSVDLDGLYSVAHLIKISSNEWIINGDIVVA